jgi:hypothetical protein
MSIQKTPIAILQAAWKRIAPLELADTTWDNVSDVRGVGSTGTGLTLLSMVGLWYDRSV